MEIALLIAAGLAASFLGYGNGANDISKTIATLIGSGETSFRKAATAGAFASGLGAFASAFLATRMLQTFSKGLLAPEIQPNPAFALAVIIGAVVWVLLSTRIGMPVSTTHSITGAIALTGIAAYGYQQVMWSSLTHKIVLPLLLSPIVALVVTFVIFGAVNLLFKSCRGGTCGFCHWISALSASFARGFNDIPKIVALLFVFALAYGYEGSGLAAPLWMYLIVGAGATLGALIGGLRVTDTLAYKVTDLSHEEGLTANLTTSLLVIWTAIRGLPVSTTHISSFAIMGAGLRDGIGAIRWRTLAEMGLAWVVTLPLSGLFAAAAYGLFNRMLG